MWSEEPTATSPPSAERHTAFTASRDSWDHMSSPALSKKAAKWSLEPAIMCLPEDEMSTELTASSNLYFHTNLRICRFLSKKWRLWSSPPAARKSPASDRARLFIILAVSCRHCRRPILSKQ